MAYLGSANDAFSEGQFHTVNPGRSNDNSIVLDGALQAVSDHWNGTTPHAVLNNATGGGSNDPAFEQYQREQGGYQPGSMTSMADQLDQGNDNLS